jgi:hypothetical protein
MYRLSAVFWARTLSDLPLVSSAAASLDGRQSKQKTS